jgi:hypothetical protein
MLSKPQGLLQLEEAGKLKIEFTSSDVEPTTERFSLLQSD